MSEMTAFQSEQLGQVQTIVIDGVPWFVGVDVCKDLEIRNNRDAMERLDEDEKLPSVQPTSFPQAGGKGRGCGAGAGDPRGN